MAGFDYAAIVDSYRAVRGTYVRLAGAMEDRLRGALDAQGFSLVDVSGRAKELHSFGKKAVRKPYTDPVAEMGDKAGVRIVIPFISDLSAIEGVAASVLELFDRDDKRHRLRDKELGYLGVHYRARLLGELSDDEADLAGLEAELQIHTKAESAWAVASHDLLYKATVQVPVASSRRMHRLVALVEIFDEEVARFQQELAEQPGFRELQIVEPLERALLPFTPLVGDPDKGLSGLIIPALMSLYDDNDPVAVFEQRIKPWVDENQEWLATQYPEYNEDERANPLLFQPEALLIFERLDADRFQLRQAWPVEVPAELLENMAAVRGTNLG